MKNRTGLKIITILIPVLIVLIFLLQRFILAIVPLFPPCLFYSIFHLYCPGCGNTRSVIAILHGDLLSSLRYNTIPLLLLIIMFLGYIELASYSFGRYLRILPRKLSIYLVGIAFIVLYLIVRNFIPYLTP